MEPDIGWCRTTGLARDRGGVAYRRPNSIAVTKMADQAPEFSTDAAAPTCREAWSECSAVLVTATVIATLYFAREVFVPITLAILLSFLLAPAVRALRRLRVGRVTAVGFTALFAFIALAAFAAVVVGEVSSLAQQLPEYRYNLETKIRSLPALVPGGESVGRQRRSVSSARSFRGRERRLRQRAPRPPQALPASGQTNTGPISRARTRTAADRSKHHRTATPTNGGWWVGNCLRHHDPARAGGPSGSTAAARRKA